MSALQLAGRWPEFMTRPKHITNVTSLYFCPNGQYHLVFPPMIENVDIRRSVTSLQLSILAAKPDDLRSILGAHMMKRDK